VLERLVGLQRPAEGEAAGQPLAGHLQHRVHHAGELRALQHDRDLELPFHRACRLPDHADHGAGTGPDAVIADAAEAAREV